MKKIIVFCLAALMAVPLTVLMNPTTATDDSQTVDIETLDMATRTAITRTLTRAQAQELEKAAAEGRTGYVCDLLGISFDFGFASYVFSYGRGDVYVPLTRDCALLSPERSFIFRFLLRPVFFNYYAGGMTFVKFGANYLWKGPTVLDYGYMLGDQCGMMLGFYGTHIRIPWLLRPDTHIFVGGSLLTVGYNKFL